LVTVGSPSLAVPPQILGMVSCAGGASKLVHRVSPAHGVSHVTSKLAHYVQRASSSNRGHRANASAAQHYIDAVTVCADWHSSSALDLHDWEVKGFVALSQTDGVEAIVRAVVEDPATNVLSGRVILWDSLAVTVDAAEMMAAAAIDVMDTTYPGAVVDAVEIWQCFHRPPQRLRVAAATARLAKPRLAAFVASM
jgi:hypothetical protein